MGYKEKKLEELKLEMSGDPKLEDYLGKQELGVGTELTKRWIYLKYMKLHDMNMTELLAEAREDEKKGLYIEERKINKRLHEMVLFSQGKLERMKNKDGTIDTSGKIKNSTLKTHMKFIRAFYNNYKVVLPTIKLPRVIKSRSRFVTIDDARKALNACKSKYRPMFHLQMTSGLDISTVCSLNYSHFIEAISSDLTIRDPLMLKK